MRSLPSTYILSPINHKETYDLTGDIKLQIDKSYENNLRERNPQLGTVEAICDDNPLELKVGDVVAVNHFTFYGDIGKNKSFTLKDHVEWEGKKLFRALPRQIYFKYNNQIPEPIGNVVLCSNVDEVSILGFDPNQGSFFRTSEFSQKGTVVYGNGEFEKGDEVLVLKSAMYLITLDKVDYFKVMKNEIVAKLIDGESIPVGDNIIVEYMPDEYQNGYSPLLVGTGVSITNNVTAKVVSIPADKQLSDFLPLIVDDSEAEEGQLQVYRNQGVPYNGKWIISPETIVYSYEKA